MPTLPGMPHQPGPGRNSKRQLRRLKSQVANERGAMLLIKQTLGQMGYQNLADHNAIADAVADMADRLSDFESGAALPPNVTQPVLHAQPSVTFAPAPDILPALQMAFQTPPVKVSLALPDLRLGMTAQQPVLVVSAPAPALLSTPAASSATNPGELEYAVFQEKLKAKMRESERTGVIHRSPGSSSVTRGAPKVGVEEQYEIINKITGKHAAPAPASGIPNLAAR